MVKCCRVLYARSFAARRIAVKSTFISLLESPNGVRFENVYSKSQQPKYRYLENLFTSIDEIGYFTFSNNSDVVPPSEARPNSIFIFDDAACDKQDTVREYFWVANCFYLCQMYARIPKHDTRQREPSDPVKTGWYQLEIRLQ